MVGRFELEFFDEQVFGRVGGGEILAFAAILREEFEHGGGVIARFGEGSDGGLVGLALVFAVIGAREGVRLGVYKTNAVGSGGAVGEFVGDDSGEFGLVSKAGEEAGREVDAASGEGCDADVRVVYKTNCGGGGELAGDSIDVVARGRVLG
jgi:hypothetical protein